MANSHMPLEWTLPDGASAVRGPRGLRIVADAGDLRESFLELERLCVPKNDVVLGPWFLRSVDDVPEDPDPNHIFYSVESWGIIPNICADVGVGRYSSPLDFDFPMRDQILSPGHFIGASLLGVTRLDWRVPRGTPDCTPPEEWRGARRRLERYGLGATIFPSGHIWHSNLVSLTDGGIVLGDFAAAPTMEEVVDLLLYDDLPSGLI